MGANFNSIHFRTDDRSNILGVLTDTATQKTAKFLVGPLIDGWISVFPDDVAQSDEVIQIIMQRLPIDCFVLNLWDDDVFSYAFYREGSLVDEYNSNPDYFGPSEEEEHEKPVANPDRYQDLLLVRADLPKVQELMSAHRQPAFIFEQERMEQFAGFLGISNALSSYDYLKAGECQGIQGWKQFVHIPDLNAEKEARRAAKAAMAAEKKQLKKAGILLAEIKPPGPKGAIPPWGCYWSIDSTDAGVVFAWDYIRLSRIIPESLPSLYRLKAPWDDPCEKILLNDGMEPGVFVISPTSQWLVGEFACPDWKTLVWDWNRKEVSFEVTHSPEPFGLKPLPDVHSTYAFSADEQWLYVMQRQKLNIISLTDRKVTLTIDGLYGSRSFAVHPSGEYAVVRFQQEIGILDLIRGKLIKRHTLLRKMGLKELNGMSEEVIIQLRLSEWLLEPEVRKRLVLNDIEIESILQDSNHLQKINSVVRKEIEEKIRPFRVTTLGVPDHITDISFSPAGNSLFVACSGLRVFDWHLLWSAENQMPNAQFEADAPCRLGADDDSPPFVFATNYDQTLNLILGGSNNGIIQYFDMRTGKSGTLIKLFQAFAVWSLKLSNDRKILVCHCVENPNRQNQLKRASVLQVWNYPALLRAAGLESNTGAL